MSTSITDWLKTNDLEAYLPIFVENQVDLKTLQVLTETDLKELGLPFGPRKRILSAIAASKPREATQAPWGDTNRAPPGTGERRQVTVLFCDLVGFTEMAGRLDPEVLQSLVHSYEDSCVECVNRYGGYVFQRLGDGIVAFFGVPLAQEGGAERAVRTGLLIIDTMSRLEVPEVGRLRVRVGIASGVVVVSLSENSAVGETMNLAARLQALASPGTVVVSEPVQRMAGHAFNYVDLGEKELKGIARPTRVFQVAETNAMVSRFEAATGTHLTPLVGREHEIEALLERWRVAQSGQGQVALLSGEPGIGKSRITSALRERLEPEGVVAAQLQCSPYYLNSAFFPIISFLERRLQLRRDEPAGVRLDRLEALMVGRFGRPLEDVRFIAALLSIPCDDRYGPTALTARRQKEKTIDALVELIVATSQVQRSLIIIEDLHWADPTTLDLVDLLLPRIEKVPLLLVLTFRPEFQSRWTAGGRVTHIALGKLTAIQTGRLVSRLTGGKPLPADLLDQILARTDGVPLFVEELTRSILEMGALKDEGGRYAYAVAASEVVIPATLRDLLMARLDRVTEAKEVAQIGATIGRDFSYELIAAVAPMSAAGLEHGLRQLTGAGLAFQRGAIPQATYTFKHALVQDAAYDSLLKSRRRELHAAIARVLETRFPETKETGPEILGHHYTEAGLPGAAVPFWRTAGELAIRRFALREAGVHLQKGLTLVTALPAGPDRDRAELEVRSILGTAIVARRGWATPEVRAILAPALTLAKSLRHQKSYLPTLHGLWVHSLTSARLTESNGWAAEMLSIAEAAGDSDLEICGHRAAMTSHFWLGDLVAARAHGDIIRRLYHAERHWNIAIATNSDPLTGDGIYRPQYLWMLGYPDQAMALCLSNHRHARTRNHPFDLAFALTLGSQVFEFRGEPEELLRHAAEGERIGREHGVPVMSDVLAEISKGIAWLGIGRVAESVDQLREANTRLHQTGQQIWAPYLRARLAEAMALNGNPTGGLALIAESLDQIERQEERSHLAEVLRLQGVLCLQAGQLAEGESSLRAALDFARKQHAKSWELRAATTLARFLISRDRRSEARDLLAPVYGWFVEGFGTKDLKEARALLDNLGA